MLSLQYFVAVPVQDGSLGRCWIHFLPHTHWISSYVWNCFLWGKSSKTSWGTPTHQENMKKPTWKQVGQAGTQSHHRPHPWHGDSQLRRNSKPWPSPWGVKGLNPTSGMLTFQTGILSTFDASWKGPGAGAPGQLDKHAAYRTCGAQGLGLLPSLYLAWAARVHGQGSLSLPEAFSQHLFVYVPLSRYSTKGCPRGLQDWNLVSPPRLPSLLHWDNNTCALRHMDKDVHHSIVYNREKLERLNGQRQGTGYYTAECTME